MKVTIKKQVLATAILASVCGMAHADDGSSVTLYGILDVAVGTVQHSANASASFPTTVTSVTKVSASNYHSVTGMFNGGISDPRWGIRGSEDLGGGLHAIFDVESGFNLPTGETNNAAASVAGSGNTFGAASALDGQLFNRGAYVGLKDDRYGTIVFGRTPTLGLDILANYDPVQAAQLFSPVGYSGSYSAGGITEGSRTDNNIKYTNQVGDFNYGVSYSLGGVAGSLGAGSTFSANLGYEANGLGIQAVYDTARDAIHSGAIVGANAVGSALEGTDVGSLTVSDDEDFLIAAKYKIGKATIKAGYERYTLRAPSNPVSVGTTTDYYGYEGAVTNTVFPATTNLYFAGGDYQLSPRLDIAAGVYDTQTVQSAGVAGGNELQYSALADYHLTRRTDVYAGYMFSHYNGAAFTGMESTNYIIASGVRTMF